MSKKGNEPNSVITMERTLPHLEAMGAAANMATPVTIFPTAKIVPIICMLTPRFILKNILKKGTINPAPNPHITCISTNFSVSEILFTIFSVKNVSFFFSVKISKGIIPIQQKITETNKVALRDSGRDMTKRSGSTPPMNAPTVYPRVVTAPFTLNKYTLSFCDVFSIMKGLNDTSVKVVLNPNKAFAKIKSDCDSKVAKRAMDKAVAAVPPNKHGFLPMRSPMIPAGRENRAAAKDDADKSIPRKYSE